MPSSGLSVGDPVGADRTLGLNKVWRLGVLQQKFQMCMLLLEVRIGRLMSKDAAGCWSILPGHATPNPAEVSNSALAERMSRPYLSDVDVLLDAAVQHTPVQSVLAQGQQQSPVVRAVSTAVPQTLAVQARKGRVDPSQGTRCNSGASACRRA